MTPLDGPRPPTTPLSRPLVSMLESALSTASGSATTDIARLRDALALVLARHLDRPDAAWPDLVTEAAALGGWDEWRVGGLLAATDPADDPTPETTLDTLGTLAEELIHRRIVGPGTWEGVERQAVVASARWQEGQRIRQVVFAIERAMELLAGHDADGLDAVAATIESRDPADERFPGLAMALRACADDLRAGDEWTTSLARVRESLATTPFTASIDRLSSTP